MLIPVLVHSTHDLQDHSTFYGLAVSRVDLVGVSLESPATAMDTPALLDTASWMAAAAKPFQKHRANEARPRLFWG